MLNKDDITWGGFIKSNIRRWILKECLESGDPSNFFYALQEEIENIDDQIFEDENFWESAEGEII